MFLIYLTNVGMSNKHHAEVQKSFSAHVVETEVVGLLVISILRVAVQEKEKIS